MNSVIEFIAENPLVAVVATGEAGFWVLLGTGLTARYLLRARRLEWLHWIAPERTGQLWDWMWRLTIALVVWFVGWPLWGSLSEQTRDGAPR
jgi:hypothetical protein